MLPSKTGVVELRLASGPIPHYKEIVKLSKPIIEAVVEEFGTKEVIKRFSDPLWFNCYACVVGFEWNYSGLTTVPLMALKEALKNADIGIQVIGGKGKVKDISIQCENLGLSSNEIERLEYVSRMTCKVDSCEVQDSHNLYFHCMIVDEKSNYVTINQKMNVNRQTVRRFHWKGNSNEFVEEPHEACIGEKQEKVINLSSKDSRECRKAIVDLVRDYSPEKIEKAIVSVNKEVEQTKVTKFLGAKSVSLPFYLKIPRKVNLEALRIAHEISTNFENFLEIKGIGPATVRGLAYISNLIYGTSSSFEDPVKYTYAFGTKANKPYPVNKQAMNETAQILSGAIKNAKLNNKEKLKAIKRLSVFFS